MELVVIALGATAIAVHTVRHAARPKTATRLDPYTVWMMTNLPNLRSWRR